MRRIDFSRFGLVCLLLRHLLVAALEEAEHPVPLEISPWSIPRLIREKMLGRQMLIMEMGASIMNQVR